MSQLISLHDVLPGSQLAQPLYDKQGRVLLPSGKKLNHRHLELLRQWGIENIYISPHDSAEQGVVSETHLLSQRVQLQITHALHEVYSAVEGEKQVSLNRLSVSLRSLVSEVVSHERVAIDLVGLRKMDNHTFMHSLAVGVMAVNTGLNLGIAKNDLYALGIAAVLHDIGKLKVPLEVLNKPGKLNESEWEAIRCHPENGGEWVASTGMLRTEIGQAVFEHHERYDGSGYPKGISGSQIGLFGRILAIADVYDAMTSDRIYKQKLPPHVAVEQLMAQSSQFDPEILRVFFRNLVVFPVGSWVVLDNGAAGKVTSYHRDSPCRPQVLLLKDSSGNDLHEPLECDLMTELSRFVAKVVSFQ